ncbi:myst histone acetyltransferase [Achlya hypogyna]|uniref:Histone acetyltransferase n=1 Tax=Achlya hypogyna TaxID=1202772 RepID=A0A1V9YH89_ACHHY|nr:myst histone acetyltransferase [Achlya hypogyna]
MRPEEARKPMHHSMNLSRGKRRMSDGLRPCVRSKTDSGVAHCKRKRSNDSELDKHNQLLEKYQSLDAASVKLMQKVPRIELGRFVVETWYPSPYPAAFYPDGKLYVCESCLSYTSTKRFLEHHMTKECRLRKKPPPGPRVYFEKADDLALFEVDGKTEPTYAQNLCLLAKLFMDQKTLYFDVTHFRFYVLCRVDKEGYHIVGYFSKEKVSPEHYNLSCIVIFPQFQRNGYGTLLISISYEISKHDGLLGTPERPLSAHGRATYLEYWKTMLLPHVAASSSLTVGELAACTGMLPEDVAQTLKACDLLRPSKTLSEVASRTIRGMSSKVRAELASLRALRLCNPRQFAWNKVATT